jgi:predicted membrane protein
MARPSSSTWLGIILLVVGLLFLFQQLGWFSIGRLLSLLWPLLLIYLGWTLYRQSQEAGTSADGEVLSRSSFFGDFAIASTSKSLRSVKIWSLFGDGKIDLLEAQPTPNATLGVVLLFADLKVEVPDGWRVESNAVMVIGDLKLPPSSETTGAQPAPTLTITGFSLFGDIKVRSRPLAPAS